MAAAVTSGLGRHGPWLQNAYLRLETRTDDGSISPVALAGGFRPSERALAFVAAGSAVLTFGRCEYNLRAHEDAVGIGRLIELRSRHRAGFVLRREAVLYDAHPFCVTRVGITSEHATPVAVATLHVFTTAEGRGRLRVSGSAADLRFYRHGWQSWSPTMSLGGAAVDLQSAPAVLSPGPPETQPGRFASDDVGVLHDPAAAKSLLVGAISARDVISQVVVDAPARSIDARCLADGIELAPGETLWSEWFAVDLCGAPQEQLQRYGDTLGRAMGARVPARTPSGWCSWYYFYTRVTEEDVIRNLRYLEQHRRELPLETIQIDDGYQADIGDWLTVNEKFPHGMRWLATQIREAGFVPGIWLAPFFVSQTSRALAMHPDFVVRDSAGQPVLAMRNWERDCYGIDGTNPEARAWLTGLFREICDGWGYDYVKIDFLFGAAVAGVRHDPQATRVRAYRQALAAVRAGVGDKRFILGCGALMAPSVGVFDGNRIGPDTAPFWRFLTRAERALPVAPVRQPDDNLSAETATRNVINRWWMHGRLWANDPDCMMVRDDRTKLSQDEVETLASVIGLSGGMMLISDDLPLLSRERVEMASMFLPPLPHSATPIDLTLSDMPGRLDYVDDRAFDPVRLVGLFNFDDEPKDLRLETPDGRWHGFDVWAREYAAPFDRNLMFELVPAHACRVLALRPLLGRPQLVGSDAHFGAGIVDVTGVSWDESASTLAVDLAPVGRARRRVWISGAGRTIERAECQGVPVSAQECSAGCYRIPLQIEAPARLTMRFGPPEVDFPPASRYAAATTE